jgi:NAD(P)-dependent dehydrogenase (short-subunit alcohol dehydrogenase family)
MTNRSASPTGLPAALVTGAGDRIGAAIARTLARNGFAVAVHYRSDAEGARAVRDEIRRAGGTAEIVRADLSRRGQRSSLIARTTERVGPLHLLVNNASLFDPDSATDVDEAEWDRHFAIHAEAPVFLARDFAAQLPEGAEGNIVNIVDERVLHPSPAYFSYTLSKSVLWMATRTMAQTLAPHIRVNAIGPGPVLPHSRQDEATFIKQVKDLPLGRNAGPEAIADGVLTLVRTPSLTGQMLALDGGNHLEYPARRAPTPRK